jgi:3D (Asp-Asp-Asp) domain-containing protein
MRSRVIVGAAAAAALLVVGAVTYLVSSPSQVPGVSVAGAAGAPIIGGATSVTSSGASTTTGPAATTTTSGTATTTAGKPSTTTKAPPPAAPPPAQQPPAQQPSPNASGPITFYGAADNDPPGSRQIAFPNVMHGQAGGTGTFADPITFAAQQGRFAPGTKIYVPDVQRYFVLEDTCADCAGPHIDLWTGAATDGGIVRCEDSLTRNGSRPYQLNPPAGLPVSAGDLYSNGHCFRG